MKIYPVSPRKDFNQFLEKTGYHDVPYIESNYIAEISAEQAEILKSATREVYTMCLAAVGKVIEENRFKEFGIGELQAKHIRESWNRPLWSDGSTRDPELMSRIDFCWDGDNNPKFYEINADTPGNFYECAVLQRTVKDDLVSRGELPEDMEQLNTLEEKTTERLSHIFNMASQKITDTLHLASNSNADDMLQVKYLETLAQKAGWKTEYLDASQIGACEDSSDENYGALFDAKDKRIDALYKFIPWELIHESGYAEYVARDEIMFLEPAWKALLSNKMLSVILWEMYPNHPYLLASYTTPDELGNSYVEKPIFGLGGAGIKIVKDGKVIAEGHEKDGPDVPKIYQEYHPLPEAPGLAGRHYQTGTWIVGNGDVAGMDVRIGNGMIMDCDKKSKFLPHVVNPKQTSLKLEYK